jgi:hypothetical protein
VRFAHNGCGFAVAQAVEDRAERILTRQAFLSPDGTTVDEGIALVHVFLPDWQGVVNGARFRMRLL